MSSYQVVRLSKKTDNITMRTENNDNHIPDNFFSVFRITIRQQKTFAMKQINILLILIVFATFPSFAKKDKKTDRELVVKNLIESTHYRFVARTAQPMSGGSINLTSEYDLQVDSTQIRSFLPFFGRAYYAEYGSSEGGIKFDAKAEEYTVDWNAKKKTYRIDIKVKGKRDVYQLILDVGISGYANLNIISNDKQSISFYGAIEKLESL